MRKFFLGAVLLLAGLISGCDQFKGVSISEELINGYLAKNVHYQKRIELHGIANADIELTELSSQIGRTEPNKIALTGRANVTITSLLGPTKAEMKITLKAQPVFEQEKEAIFLKELEIVDYQITPEKMEKPINALVPYLNKSLNSFFDTHPVYVLKPEHSKAEAAAKTLAERLEVKPGKLFITLADK
ncbi:lipoprotein [Photorhabdus luminescens]|uniref:lipoprotein n=1 Tax=Photorhabdus luminescens TaxID=29488 RepID=UPI00223EFE84|nr:lipoprotein [Photorhabdus luminescens]MCW7763271.1 lipoprotein [Photorhabdus luminescens subsp. venezuelensis]